MTEGLAEKKNTSLKNTFCIMSENSIKNGNAFQHKTSSLLLQILYSWHSFWPFAIF